jgi:hypothetical protein
VTRSLFGSTRCSFSCISVAKLPLIAGQQGEVAPHDGWRRAIKYYLAANIRSESFTDLQHAIEVSWPCAQEAADLFSSVLSQAELAICLDRIGIADLILSGESPRSQKD